MGVHFLSRYRNPLAYPAGYKPGFDPSHPCAAKTVLSTVHTGANQVNLLNGAVGTITGSLATNIDGRLGPSMDLATSSTNYINFSGFGTAAVGACTMAFILKFSSAVGYNYILGYGVNPGVHCFFDDKFHAGFGFVVDANSTLTYEVGVPYFVAFSWVAGSPVEFYVKNLQTGVLKTISASSAVSQTPTSGNIYLGTSEWDHQVTKNFLAATMISRSYTPPSAMHQWCDDPWPFWYPNPGDNWIAAQAASGLFKITGNPRSLAGFGGGLAA